MSAPGWVVPLSDVVGDEELVAAAADAIRSGWWSSGPRVAGLEAELAAFTEARHALACANGTAALHLSLAALGVGPDDEVITPSLTFVAAANVVRLLGGSPVFCDVVGGDDPNLDPRDLEAAITRRTKAIVAMHYGGHPCDMRSVCEIARRHGVAVVEDAAHALGATYEGRPCGTIGDVGCFSFFSNKNLPIGEGGAVVTNDDDLAQRLRLLRSHGMTTMTWDRHRGHASSYDVVDVGFNFRLDEIRAAMASIQLGRLRGANRVRRELVELYADLLHERDGLRVAFAGDGASAAHHLAVLILPVDVDRDRVRGVLASAGIQTSVHYPPIHRFSAYSSYDGRPLPRTDAIAPRLLTLPLYPRLERSALELVSSTLVEAISVSLKSGASPTDDGSVRQATTRTS